jgi:hypothetical protein
MSLFKQVAARSARTFPLHPIKGRRCQREVHGGRCGYGGRIPASDLDVSVVGVLTAIAIIPSAPVLVPELAGSAASEVADLRRAAFTAVAALPDRWIAVGVGRADAVISPDRSGSFGGYGVDVRVGLSPLLGEVTALPLCALVTGWVRGQVRPQARAEVRVFAGDHDPDAALHSGRELRSAVDQYPDPVGVLVVADGAHTLTQAAPGGYDAAATRGQAAFDDALADGDVAAMTPLSAATTGRVAWQVLAGIAGGAPRSAKELYRGAPFGVGYFVGIWQA